MIFSKNQLLPEDKSKFATLWMANNKGITFIETKDVLNVKLLQLCEDISNMIDYETARFDKCLSLGLAASLIYGMFIVCNKKASILLDDVLKFSISLKNLDSLQFSKPNKCEKPIVKKRKRTTNQNKDLKVSTKAELTFRVIGAPLLELDPLIHSAATPLINEEEFTITGEVIEAVRTPLKKRKQQDHVSTPTKKRMVESSVVTIPDKLESPPRDFHDDSIKNLIPIDFVNQEVNFPNFDIRDKSKRQQGVTPTTTFCTVKTSKKNINLQISFSQEIFEPPEFTRFPQCTAVSVTDLLSILFQGEECEVYKRKASFSQGESLLTRLPRHTTFNIRDPSIEEIQRKGLSSVLDEMHLQQLLANISVGALHYPGSRNSYFEGIECIPAAVEDPAANVHLEVEPFIRDDESFIGKPQNFDKIVINETSARRSKFYQRHKLIRHIVKYWNYEEKGPITIEDVCPRPINRFNIAVTFGDILNMTKHGYVFLHCDEETLKLTIIEKGWKLLEN